MSETVEQVGGMDESAGCPWCGDPVEAEGVTCDLVCYALWWEWGWEHRHVGVWDGVGSAVVPLTAGEKVPLDIMEQPWYLGGGWIEERREGVTQ